MLNERIILETSRFRVAEIQQQLASGEINQREVVRHPGSVVIIPFLEENKVCLIKNKRVSVGRELIELPAGTLEPNEPALACAERELAEETGYRANDVRPLMELLPAPGILDERMQIFVAYDLTAGPPSREPGEEIQNLVVTWDEAVQLVKEQKIVDAKTIVGILYAHFLLK